jgi:hypothetical protein
MNDNPLPRAFPAQFTGRRKGRASTWIDGMNRMENISLLPEYGKLRAPEGGQQ